MVQASSIRQMHMDDMLTTAELVFQGTVVKSEARLSANGRFIKTYIEFEVVDVISGDYQQSTLELSFVGGTVGDRTMEAEGSRHPQVNESGIYFVESVSRSLVNPLVGWSQGHFLVEEDDAGNKMVMTNSKQPVTGVLNKQTTITRSAALSSQLSRGVVSGVSTDATKSSPMTATNFKQALRSRIKQLEQLQISE